MAKALFIGVPGPMEIIIILAVVGVIVGIVLVAVRAGSRSGPGPTYNPNLYPCPDCGRMVSRQAPNCPKCGKPLLPP